jgi:TetR/AcrR family acrAB operon transcriptional repressor
MVRKTKEEALATRGRILDAAEELFQAQGVAGTSLQDIAAAAGVTRGAIYWHFEHKGDLFNAMMERVCLPLEQSAPACARGAAPLEALREHLVGVLAQVAADPKLQRVFDIATHKVEYVGEMCAVRDRHLSGRADHLAVVERALKAAQRRHEVVRTPARTLAIGVHALVDGLIHNWMLDPAGFDLAAVGAHAIDVHFAGLAVRS